MKQRRYNIVIKSEGKECEDARSFRKTEEVVSETRTQKVKTLHLTSRVAIIIFVQYR